MIRKTSYLAAALIATTVGAAAQTASSTEIYGQIGMGLNKRTHQQGATGSAALTDMTTSVLAVSNLGFRGREDLGGGLTALYRLETTIAPDTGFAGKAGGAFFDRQSFVGMSSRSWGQLTFGRQFHASTDRVIRTLDVYQVAPANAHFVPLALTGVDRFQGNDNRVNNSIKYRMDRPSGFQGGASYGLGEVANSSKAGSSYAFDLGYNAANFAVGALHVHFNSPTPIAATGATPKHTFTGVGGNATFGAFKPYVAYYDAKLESATLVAAPTQSNKITQVGLAWTGFAPTVLRAAWSRDKATSLNNVAGRDGSKTTIVLTGEYFLSKRTSLYAAAARNSLGSGYLQDPVWKAALGRNATDSSVSFYSVGMNHTF